LAISIRDILSDVAKGQIRIPAFQRGFVWEPDRVAYLMDSLYKGYPFGSVLFWRTKEQLKVERDLGPFKLPDPKVDYPIDYVLDGQQRITSIFGVFQTELENVNTDVFWQDVYFDLSSTDNPQDAQFLALPPSDVDPVIHFPLKVLFDSVAYRKATNAYQDQTLERIDRMQAIFKECLIPTQVSTTEDKATVALIFERVNRQGVPLDTLQLLSAWTWSEEFQLQEEFQNLSEDLKPFGFSDIGEDTNLILRCCSAILTDDAAPEKLLTLNGQVVRENFGRITNGLKYAVDYLRKHLGVFSVANLPYSTMLVPLSVFFAVDGNKESSYTDEQRIRIDRWFWRAAFSRRYSSAVLRNLNADVQAMKKLRDGTGATLGDFSLNLSAEFFTENHFVIGNVNTKTFILLLAQEKPKSFISGAPVDLAATLKDSNRTEFHHLMPRSFLKSSDQLKPSENVLANFAFLSRSDNRAIGGVAPSIYLDKIGGSLEDVLSSALCPDVLFSDNYSQFIAIRKGMLAEKAAKLTA
jgi:hypothetical protein